jgi:hypothetical protein
MRRACLAVAVVGALLALGAVCGEPLDERDAGSTFSQATLEADGVQPPTGTATPILKALGEVDYDFTSAEDTAALMASAPYVFVASVERRGTRLEPDFPPGSEPRGTANINNKPPVDLSKRVTPYTFYELAVVQPISYPASPGERLQMMQGGGDIIGDDGRLERWVGGELDRLLEVGKVYLIFAFEQRPDVYATAPWGKFEVQGDTLVTLNPDLRALGVVREIESLGITNPTDALTR